VEAPAAHGLRRRLRRAKMACGGRRAAKRFSRKNHGFVKISLKISL
jgi:hypothetical protein